MHTSDFDSNLSVLTFSTCAGQAQICKCCRLGFRPDHNSRGVLDIDLDGTRFSMYIAVSKAYPQKDIGDLEKLIIDLIISKRVRFLLSATPFCWGIPGADNWDIIPFPYKYPIKSAERYSPPRSDRKVLILLPNYFSTSTRNSLNFSKASYLWCIRYMYPYLE